MGTRSGSPEAHPAWANGPGPKGSSRHLFIRHVPGSLPFGFPMNAVTSGARRSRLSAHDANKPRVVSGSISPRIAASRPSTRSRGLGRVFFTGQSAKELTVTHEANVLLVSGQKTGEEPRVFTSRNRQACPPPPRRPRRSRRRRAFRLSLSACHPGNRDPKLTAAPPTSQVELFYYRPSFGASRMMQHASATTTSTMR